MPVLVVIPPAAGITELHDSYNRALCTFTRSAQISTFLLLSNPPIMPHCYPPPPNYTENLFMSEIGFSDQSSYLQTLKSAGQQKAMIDWLGSPLKVRVRVTVMVRVRVRIGVRV